MSITRKIYKLSHGFKAYECDNFYDKLEDFLSYKPCSLAKSKIKKKLGDTIKFVVIDASLWSKMVAFWQKRLISLAYGFYDVDKDAIFINLRTCGIQVTKDCKFNTVPTTSTLKKLSEIVAHELIHYLFQNYTIRVLDKTKDKLKLFYKTYWKHVVDDDLLPALSKAHFYVATNTNKNALDPILGKITKIQVERFIKILENIQDNYKSRLIDKQTFSDTLECIKSLLEGSILPFESVTKRILLSYKSIVNDFPPRTLQVGQELIYSSEILSVCANIRGSSEAQNLVSKILNLL